VEQRTRINLSRVRHNIAAASSVVALSLGALVAATPAQAQAQSDGAPTDQQHGERS
jgi:hypothetical protein